MRLLVTGGRRYSDAACVVALLDRALLRAPEDGDLVVVHGDADGLDTLADRWTAWRRAQWGALPRGGRFSPFMAGRAYARPVVEPHPAQWTRPDGSTDRGAGIRRNAEMVALGADACLSFPGGIGTADCSTRAAQRGIPVGTPVLVNGAWDIQWWRTGSMVGPLVDGRSNRLPFSGGGAA